MLITKQATPPTEGAVAVRTGKSRIQGYLDDGLLEPVDQVALESAVSHDLTGPGPSPPLSPNNNSTWFSLIVPTRISTSDLQWTRLNRVRQHVGTVPTSENRSFFVKR
jgi:hypothetical protein